MTKDWFQMEKSGGATYYSDTEKGWSRVHLDDLPDAYLKVVEAEANAYNEIFCIVDE